ncbi:MAG TPA: hypothetical protein PLO61_07350 [Fimbriimonadaceae bacterium]|nr:hypothetical protein [Fimbriimonadaceae bacterium]HRJ32942.1 hypothetical protein [Fimbriimonadaceae bacterium]
MHSLTTRFLIAALGLALLGGCQAPKREAGTSPAPTTPSETTADAPASPGEESDAAQTEQAAQPKAVPAVLLHEGARYYGLNHTQSLTYRFREGESEPVEGEQQVRIAQVSDDRVELMITRSGGLGRLGNSEMKLDKYGVWTVRQQGMNPKTPVLEIIPNFQVGSSWNIANDMEFGDSGTTMKFKATYKAVREEKVTTPAGEFQAILVTVDGQFESEATRGTIQTRSWLVRDIGLVKMTSVANMGTQKNQVELVLLKKPA